MIACFRGTVAVSLLQPLVYLKADIVKTEKLTFWNNPDASF